MISNNEQLQITLLNSLQVAIDNVLNQCLEKLRGIIFDTVYGAGEPLTYQTTWEFMLSWEVNNATIKGLMVQGELFQNFMSMSYDPDNFIHGSNYSGDIREFLADIINNGIDGGLFGDGWYSKSRCFWDEFVLWVEDNIDMIFQNECKKLGINMRGIGLYY